MDTLQIAYQILYSLEHKEKADYMGQLVSPAALDVPEDKWLDVLQALQDDGCVSGAKFSKDVHGNHYANIQNLRITLKGAEFLSEKQHHAEDCKGGNRCYYNHQTVSVKRCLKS